MRIDYDERIVVVVVVVVSKNSAVILLCRPTKARGDDEDVQQ